MTGVELFAIGTAVVSLADVAAVAAVAASAAAAAQQGAVAQKRANFEAGAAQQQAAREQQIASLEAARFERQESAVQAQSRARRGASGVSVGSGSSLLVDAAMVEESLFGAALIRSAGEARATRLRQQADLSRFDGRAARSASFLKAGTTLLSGVANSSFGQSGGTAPKKPPSAPRGVPGRAPPAFAAD